MFVVIFGTASCPYCIRAKKLSEKMIKKIKNFNYRYIDIHKEGISQKDLSKIVGKTVNTVPQIFVDKKHIGGFTDFEYYLKNEFNLKTN